MRSGSTQQVNVRCFTSAGTPIGTRFTMRYVLGISLDRRTGFLHASGGRETPVLLGKRLLRFQLSWRRIVIPVETGFVASLARPGGNITGLSTLSPEISRKKLELLKEIVPKLSRVAVFGTSTSPVNAQELKEVELAAGALGVKLQYLDVLSSKDVETGFRDAVKARADAVLMMISMSVTDFQRKEIAELAVKSRLPVVYDSRFSVEAGGLMNYGVNPTTWTGAPPRM